MIQSQDIKRILSQIPSGKTMPIKGIQKLVSDNFLLTDEDLQPHTHTRKTTYPRWKHRLQGVLHGLKSNNQVLHNKLTHQYTFL